MGLTSDHILHHPDLHGLIRQQSRLLFTLYEADPHLASAFSSHQRWLMAHAALVLHFRRDPGDPRSGLTAARYADLIVERGIASRNTAHAFVREMLHYKFARYLPGAGDGRTRPIEPTEATLGAARGWVATHLATLDTLDGGERSGIFAAAPGDPLAAIQPLIADRFFLAEEGETGERTHELFVWLNNRGIVMDRLVASIADAAPGAARIPTGVASVAEMAKWFRLSRTHLARKLREAETMGAIGWEGTRGRSALWVSRAFLGEYMKAQAVKLAIIDDAFDICFC